MLPDVSLQPHFPTKGTAELCYFQSFPSHAKEGKSSLPREMVNSQTEVSMMAIGEVLEAPTY